MSDKPAKSSPRRPRRADITINNVDMEQLQVQRSELIDVVLARAPDRDDDPLEGLIVMLDYMVDQWSSPNRGTHPVVDEAVRDPLFGGN